MMDYRKHIETKIIRTEHHVFVWPGGTAAGLIKAVQQVPPKAQLMEAEQIEGTSQTKLIFCDENAVEHDGDHS